MLKEFFFNEAIGAIVPVVLESNCPYNGLSFEIKLFFLQVECRDALLHAINEEFVEAVEVLLDHEETIHKPGDPHVSRIEMWKSGLHLIQSGPFQVQRRKNRRDILEKEKRADLEKMVTILGPTVKLIMWIIFCVSLQSWEAIPPDTASFTQDISPLVLGAHRDNYEIIKILLDRGATLPMPHDVRYVIFDFKGNVNAVEEPNIMVAMLLD